MKIIPIVLLGFSIFLLSSCDPNSSDKRHLAQLAPPPPTPLLARSLGWALVVSSYAQVFDLPQSDSVVLGYYRQNTIVPISERRRSRTAGDTPYWVRNQGDEPGWLKETDVKIFDNEAKAKTAAGASLR
jgi:hypothetical protein